MKIISAFVNRDSLNDFEDCQQEARTVGVSVSTFARYESDEQIFIIRGLKQDFDNFNFDDLKLKENKMSDSCVKCGKCVFTSWLYEKDVFGERLRRRCLSCGHQTTKKCLDDIELENKLNEFLKKENNK